MTFETRNLGTTYIGDTEVTWLITKRVFSSKAEADQYNNKRDKVYIDQYYTKQRKLLT